MFKKIKARLAKEKSDKATLEHLQRFTNMLSWVVEKGDTTIQVNLDGTVVVTVFNTINGTRVRLCEINSNNLERALYEVVLALHGQGNCSCHGTQQASN